MCGICGIYNLAHDPLPDPDAVGRMAERLIHRGPDSHGKFALPYLSLAIRRLSIIDLETGDQPLANETGEVVVVFNGEIYNYRELRETLLLKGHHFKTHSDGEVTAHLYEEEGPDFVRRLNGMFAIALWDSRAKRLVLARDRAGEKPLFYWQRGRTLAFASEIKSLLEYPPISRELDPKAIEQYFFYGYFPAPQSVFAEISKLPAAHRMVVEGGRVQIDPYWRLQDHLRPPGAGAWRENDEHEAVEELRLKIRAAAVSRLVSDVPLGVFLSGGVDSSAIVAVMSELSPGNINSFSVAFPERGYNEENYAALVAHHFRTRHHVLRADEPSLREALLALAEYLDEPLADPASLPTWLLARFARREIKVALSGEGGDELFGGYPTYQGARLADYYCKLPQFARRAIRGAVERALPVSSSAAPAGLFLRRFFAHAERELAERHLIWFGMFSPTQLDRLFSPDWKGPQPPSREIFGPLHRALEGARFEDAIAELLYLDFRLYLEDNLLVKVDRASMACSLELRTPLLDHRLIEFAAGLPSSAKLKGFKGKSLFKKAVAPWLPREITERQKRGFSVPIAQWMRNELRPMLDETLAEEKLRCQGIFNARFVRQMLAEHWSGKADHRRALWTLFVFELWHRQWVARS